MPSHILFFIPLVSRTFCNDITSVFGKQLKCLVNTSFKKHKIVFQKPSMGITCPIK